MGILQSLAVGVAPSVVTASPKIGDPDVRRKRPFSREGALQGNALQLYTDWKLKRLKQKGASVDGRTVVNTHLLAISEPFEPDKLAYLCPPL